MRGYVALIKKSKPDWQAGRWNGIGGKVEPTDASDAAAMAREFEEETGVWIEPAQWRRVGTMANPQEGWAVEVFTAVDPHVSDVDTMEEEEVKLWHPDAFMYYSNRSRVMNNVPALIQLCQIEPERHGVPKFALVYQ